METQVEVAGVHHIAIKALDVERVAAFYRDVLGLKDQARHEDARGLRSIWLDGRGVILMVERSEIGGAPIADDPPGQAKRAASEASEEAGRRIHSADNRPGLHLLAFAIDPRTRDAWRAHLIERGLPIAGETRFTIYTRDPEGNRVGLSSWPEPSA